MVYTLGEAAKAAGKTKGAISKAIQKGRVSAKKNEDGSYSIDPSELHRVYPPVSITQDSKPSTITHEETEKIIRIKELEIRLDATNKENGLLQQQIEELRADKDFLQGEMRKTTLLLSESNSQKRRGFWQRLFNADNAA